MMKQLVPLLTLASLAAPASAAVLWTTTFSGTDEASRTLTNTNGDVSFTDNITATYNNLLFSDTTFTAPDFKNVGSRTYFSPNTNVDNPAAAGGQNGGSWQAEFRYAGGSQSITLENVVFDVVWSASTAALQAGDTTVRDITLTAEYSLDGGLNWANIAAAQTYNLTVNPGTAAQQHQDRTFTLGSPLVVDHASQDLWIRVKAENANATAGAYVNLRDITFNGLAGAPVPEPSVALLGGLGLIGLLRRRR